MSTSKRRRAPLIVTFGVIMAAMTFAGPANAAEHCNPHHPYPVCTGITVLGASASWTTDTKAVISSSGPGVYQAVTTGTGGPSQFFRIKH